MPLIPSNTSVHATDLLDAKVGSKTFTGQRHVTFKKAVWEGCMWSVFVEKKQEQSSFTSVHCQQNFYLKATLVCNWCHMSLTGE